MEHGTSTKEFITYVMNITITSFWWKVDQNQLSGGGQGAGAQENRGAGEGGRGWKEGEQGAGSGRRNKEGNSLLFITGYYSVKNAYLAKF